MENFDQLIISLLDSDAMKGCFKKELSKLLNIPVDNISDIWLQTNLIEGVASQMLYVATLDVDIKKDDLINLPFHHIYENCIVFEVGDTIL